MSKRSRQKRVTLRRTIRQRYNREIHGQGLVEFMTAFDDPDLADGAWQSMLEDGGDAYAEEFQVAIDGYTAFIEYVALTEEGVQNVGDDLPLNYGGTD